MIGLHGKMGSGKDTLLERMRLQDSRFERHSFADPLKESACALLGISRYVMEELKREDEVALVWDHHEYGVIDAFPEITMRAFLQRYGTEAHRDVFGQNFWVDQAMRIVDRSPGSSIPVFTDVRFENEALSIRARGGFIVHVIGDDVDTGDHASEAPLPPALIDFTIDNSMRGDEFAALDRHITFLLDELGVRA